MNRYHEAMLKRYNACIMSLKDTVSMAKSFKLSHAQLSENVGNRVFSSDNYTELNAYYQGAVRGYSCCQMEALDQTMTFCYLLGDKWVKAFDLTSEQLHFIGTGTRCASLWPTGEIYYESTAS